jgi:hypothetical protein
MRSTIVESFTSHPRMHGIAWACAMTFSAATVVVGWIVAGRVTRLIERTDVLRADLDAVVTSERWRSEWPRAVRRKTVG